MLNILNHLPIPDPYVQAMYNDRPHTPIPNTAVQDIHREVVESSMAFIGVSVVVVDVVVVCNKQ